MRTTLILLSLLWKELSEDLRPDHFNIGNLRARLDRLKRDPWRDFFTIKQRLPKPKR